LTTSFHRHPKTPGRQQQVHLLLLLLLLHRPIRARRLPAFRPSSGLTHRDPSSARAAGKNTAAPNIFHSPGSLKFCFSFVVPK
jgi:hypothetical protein